MRTKPLSSFNTTSLSLDCCADERDLIPPMTHGPLCPTLQGGPDALLKLTCYTILTHSSQIPSQNARRAKSIGVLNNTPDQNTGMGGERGTLMQTCDKCTVVLMMVSLFLRARTSQICASTCVCVSCRVSSGSGGTRIQRMITLRDLLTRAK